MENFKCTLITKRCFNQFPFSSCLFSVVILVFLALHGLPFIAHYVYSVPIFSLRTHRGLHDENMNGFLEMVVQKSQPVVFTSAASFMACMMQMKIFVGFFYSLRHPSMIDLINSW